ncbi:hypothetical protein KAX22_08360 [bacterium]|nr:hypothetical protein [bacterium]
MSKHQQIDLSKIKSVSMGNRQSKVHLKDFARVIKPQDWFAQLDKALPDILAGKDFRDIVRRILAAAKRNKPVIFMLGAHVIKCGLSAIIVDLMRRGIISAVALNGAGAIHDTEIAVWGHTSEDVAASLAKGSFGMAGETADLINKAICNAPAGMGFGECLGQRLCQISPLNEDHSILATGYRLSLPVTVHVALGTDVIHQHPSADGAAIGELSYRDFKIFANCVSQIGGGGVVLNFGSAVLLPEVFLKSLSLARNIRGQIKGFTTANFDMIRHYRPTMNLVQRPTQAGGRGFQIIGHHEIMIPLLAGAIRFGLAKEDGSEEEADD